MKKCVNCGEESERKYCSACGQEVEPKRLEVKTIFHDVTHGILHWDNSILRTFRELLFHPGKTAKTYISGSRISYIKPFSYFIFIQTVYVLFFHWTSGKYFAFLNIAIQNPNSIQEKIEQMQHLVNAYINYLNYFMPLFFALYFYLFFRKKTGINYAESIAISLYWFGTALFFGIVLMLISFIDIRIWNARILLNFIYLTFAALQFTNLPKVKGISKGLLVVFLSYFSYAVFVALVLFLYLYITTTSMTAN